MEEVPERSSDHTHVDPVAMPRSVRMAIALVWAIVGLAGLTAVLTWLLRDQLVREWARGNGDAMALLREGGMAALDQSSITVPAFVPLAMTSFAVVLGLAVVLVAFFRSGHGWARWSLLALVVLAVFSTGVAVARGLPAVFVAIGILSVIVEVALVRYLFHRDTGRYLRGG